MDLEQAKAALNDAAKQMELLGAQVRGANSGPRAEAYKIVSGVFRAGYQMQSVNEAMGAIEQVNNALEALQTKIHAAHGKIKQASG